MSLIAPLSVETSPPLTGVGALTPVRTACGFRHAERIREGDLLVTRDNGLQPVQLVIRGSIAAAVRLSPENAALRVARRTIGPMMPSADILIAPGQTILTPAYLIRTAVNGPAALLPARALGGTSDSVWRDRTADDQPFYAFAFGRHEILSAAGLWIESYRPVADRLGAIDDELREALLRRYPQLRDKRDPFPPCRWDSVPPDSYLPQAT